ncbi:AAA family ATPase [bacterium]|nr:AAA family ATPase [bacterium]
MFVYIGGVPGVGKTTLIRAIIKFARKTGFPLQGMEERKMLYQLTGVTSADEYQLLPEEVRSEARERMVAYFSELDRKEPKTIRIRDDHFAYLKENGTYFIRPYKSGDEIQMLAFVVVIASPETILARRVRELSSRPDRNFFDLNKIASHQEIELRTAFSQAKQLKIPIKVFENKKGELIQVSKCVFSFIKECTTNLRNG